jgi:membrane-bound lytic murein transglycosylase F
MTGSARTQRRLAIGLAAGLLLAGVLGLRAVLLAPSPNLLQRVQQGGVLVVATRRAPTSYFDGAEGPDGFEYALVKRFAQQLGVEVRFVFPATLDALLDAAARGSVHLAAAGLTITPERQRYLAFSSPYDEVTEQLLYRRGSQRPRSLQDVGAGDLHVVAGSSHEETLRQLQAEDFPELSWRPHPDIGVDSLLSAVDEGGIRLTVADSNEVELSRRLYKHVAAALDLSDPQPIAWAFAPYADESLLEAANAFLAGIRDDGRLQRLHARYYGHSGRLNFVDTREFWRNVRDRLPRYRAYFEQAEELTGIDWRLLAAIGYQESHWQPDAVSPTGVRGIMMLTQATAEQIGIEDRADPRASILGGARYLRTVEKKIPARIREPNRLWLTLAGYNVGFGHLEDARILTQRDGASPDLWFEVKKRLPLLAKKRYYTTLRHGFARGQEPVDYVDNIRNYYDLLVWYTTTKDERTRARLLAAEDA